MTASTVLPAYTKEAFIERDSEISEVQSALEQTDQTHRIRTIVFRGERGNGKTWLALHLHRTILANNPKAYSIFINLSTFPEKYKQGQNKFEWYLDTSELAMKSPENIVEGLMNWLLKILEIKPASETSLGGMKQDLINSLDQKRDDRIFVLIVDSVFETNWKLIEILEEYLLAPVASLQRTLIIMTGRGKTYPWISTYLRVESKERFLETFNKIELIEKQLARQYPQKKIEADQILQLGGGNLMANYILGTEDNPRKSLNNVADYLLSVLPSESSGKTARAALEALCLLDNFRDDEIAKMMDADNNSSSISLDEVRLLRDRLVQAQLMRWKDGGFELDPSIRVVLQNYLYVVKPEKWEHLKARAYAIYDELSDRYPRYKDFYHQKKETLTKRVEALQFTNKLRDSQPT